ncbi:MAG TPA: MFS transporter [Ignavibacteriaceae bacterium]|nr:MFS transporter [Ignavibacteriaceae bacterium]
MFRSLKYKNFRLFVEGQSLSLIGTWLQMVALTWLVYKMTNSAMILGIVGFSGQIPVFLIGPFAGVLADRWNRHKMLFVTQSLALVQALVLTILVFLNIIQIWHIISLSIFLGIINAIDMPIRQSFVFDMIEDHKEDVGNAIALNSSMVNLARLGGPTIAGLIIATLGEGWCFLLNSVSFIAVIISLIRMDIKPKIVSKKEFKILNELKEGFNYSFKFEPIRTLIFLLAIVSLVSSSLTLLAPIFAKEYLQGGASTYGFLIGAYGAGALLGAIYLLNKKNILGLGKIIVFAVVSFGLGIILFSFSRIVYISVSIMLFAGTGMMLHIASTNTLLQTIAEESKRGRVMSFYGMAFRGMSPFGSLIAGSLGSYIGAPATLVISGTVCLIGALTFKIKLPELRKQIKPIYENLGILPQIATGVQSATEPEQRKIIE